MKTIIFTCDRCGWQQPNDRKFGDDTRWMRTVMILMDDGHHTVHSRITFSEREVLKDVLWCDRCCDEVGLNHLRVSQPAPGEPPPPTLEDMLREIIRGEIESAHP